ncbi:MAG: 3-oxoacyl-ACP synthase [Gammaproteobacteria bacterium RIFCSPHIGHO2_02_FULL_42_13]|nr:MAG: 3-oxoacyl-ACP synthase [Gammaproteobacteria bacterium RIFCSPHIGHO2_02_FULL_42_13]OGT68558.1 MAG: 3-oxoacyl-ACP synthase [Gammaproteobacteria bacterium RIFCSPLOWO2_02_FULL_42_9]
MNYAKIIGTGSYLPRKVLSNKDLEQLVETSDEWISSRTGIHSRRIASTHETVTSMAEIAAQHALKMAQLEPNQIDLIIVATCTPENFFPSTACLLQHRLKIPDCIAFDMSAACSGFVYALATAEQYIRSGAAKQALVVGSEIMSRVMDWKDRNTCVLFGDGAGAVLLTQANEPGIIDSQLGASGTEKDLLTLPTGLYDDAAYVRMNGREVFKMAVEAMTNSVRHLVEENGLTVQDIDWIIPHQANIRIIKAILTRLNFPMDRAIMTIHEQGNTSGASIPLALDQGIRDHRIQPGQHLLLEAFGGGFTWGGILLKY